MGVTVFKLAFFFFLEKKVIPTNANTTEPYRFTIFLRATPPFPPECQLPRISSHATNAQFTRLVITYIPSWCAEGCTIILLLCIVCVCVCVCVRVCSYIRADGRQMFLMNALGRLGILPFVLQSNRVRVYTRRWRERERRNERGRRGGADIETDRVGGRWKGKEREGRCNIFLGFMYRRSEGCGDGEAFIKKYWYPPGCDFEGPLVFPLYRLHGLPVVLHRYPVFRINITQARVHTYTAATIKSSLPARLHATRPSCIIYILSGYEIRVERFRRMCKPTRTVSPHVT